MPLLLESLEDLKNYIEGYPGVPIFYMVTEIEKDDVAVDTITIMAGKASWEGFVKKAQLRSLEGWLVERGGRKVKGWKDIDVLFGD